ncbi:TPA: hypothetical protein CPT80_07800 [Candidatus Gastranaerophilales bacterium HUM_9]|nr:MAG TPA: hypothetical protein CPT80_07800 [Candidatus Gastranaerophilales bacterium HUM_9]HBX35105.1 hypothetical protein [Cyanobacteria bacterium UBA11440]
MERIIKLFFILFLAVCPCMQAFGDTTQTQTKMATTTDCIKTFPIGFEKLYYLTLAGINQYNYKIKEMQTKSGFIIFTDNNNKTFLASIIYVSSTKSMLKLTPCDNTYNFTIHTPTNMFNYIEANQLKTF